MSRSPLRPTVLALAVVALTTGTANARSYRATQFDVLAGLQPDRSLVVVETVAFAFEDGTFTEVFRDVPLRGTDGVTDVAVFMDGVELPRGDLPGHAEVEDGPRRLRVRWHFAATTGAHVFELRYRLLGLVTQGRDDDVLEWHVLPDERHYHVDAMRAVITVPPGAVVDPDVRLRPSSVSAVLDGSRLRLSADDLPRNRDVRVRLAMTGGAFASTRPAWQSERAARHARGPWMLGAAVVVLVSGFGWLAAFSSAWRTEAPPHVDSQMTHPPDPMLPVGISARLGDAPTSAQAMAALFDLARRGIVDVEQATTASGRGRRRYGVRLTGEPAGLQAHERTLLDIAFPDGADGRLSLSKLHSRVTRGTRRFSAAMQDDLRQRGLLDPERAQAKRTLTRAVVATLVLAAVAGLLAALWLAPAFGPWAVALPGALLAVVLGIAIVHGTFSVLTRTGLREARRWKAFYKHLRNAARAKADPAPALPHDWLPYLVASGAAGAWAKRLQKQGTPFPVPDWFRAAATDAQARSAAFVSLLTTSAVATSGGTHHAGGGGASGEG